MIRFIDIDTAEIGNIDDFNRWYAAMPSWRRAKVDEMKFEKGKQLSLAAGIALHKALAEIGIDLMSEEIEFNEYEKPLLKNHPNTYFSLSHSGTKAICAVADHEIGCDIETVKQRDHDIAKRFFHKDEVALIESLASEEEKTEMFFRLWTLKESFVKTLGTGLNTPLDSFAIIPSSNGTTVKQTLNDKDYKFTELKIADGYKCSVCEEL